ncbi:MAG: bifunctional homocysteine S-methyltransferase/methylenetetrahydrofolate reductase, partial [Acidobacteriota bacterium]
MSKSPDFRERLGQGVLLCDGAMGTYLHRRGVPMDRSFPEQTLVNPGLVESVHREYVDAGAELLKTNTYGAHRLQLERHGLADDVRKINIHGARLARQAGAGRCYIAGCVGPLGKAMEPIGSLTREEAGEVFREQIEALVEGGVDLVLVETISDLAEFDVALAVARSVSDLPVVVHKTFTEDGRTLMGELPHEVVERAEAGGADAVGANCTVGPQRMLDIIERMAQRAELPLSALPTAGLPRLVDGRIDYHAEPGYMAGYARRLAEAGATMVGACCGSTPEHIAAMAAVLQEVEIEVRRGRITVEAPTAEAREPVPLRRRSALADRLGERFVVAVDLALPRSHDLSVTIARARRLRDEAAVDAVILSDALRARLCVHPVVVASRLQEELGLESVLAYSSRDKNVLGIQSDFLGAHVMGLRNILVAPADPANFGDYPIATTLYDVGPVGLVKVLDSMNRGLDLAGNPIGEPTAFVPVVSGDPCAADLDAELRSLQEQVEAGAVGVVTQPIWDPERLEPFLEACASMGVPVVVGILPLRSARHAEFLHNEVPGLE